MLTGPRVVNARPQLNRRELGGQLFEGCVLLPGGVFFVVMGGLGALWLTRMAKGGTGGGGVFIGVAATSCLFMLIGLRILWHLYRRQAPGPATWVAKAHAPLAKSPVLPTISVRPGPNGGVAIMPTDKPLEWAISIGVLSLLMNVYFWGMTLGAFEKPESIQENPIIYLGILGFFCLASFGAFIHALLKIFVTGETVVELDREPLPPGHLARLRITQRSRVPVDHLVVKVVCEEVCHYEEVCYGGPSGTDRMTKRVTLRERVYSEVLLDLGNLQTDPTRPFVDTTFRIPPDAPPTFHADDNEICWFIHVKMVIPARPDVEDSFRFRVVPTA